MWERAGSSIWRQISPSDLPCQAISIGASFHLGLPGTPDASKFSAWWQVEHRSVGSPASSRPRDTHGTCGRIASVCVGRSLRGWQFMQRGCWMTRPASANSASERASGSPIEENEATGRRCVTSAFDGAAAMGSGCGKARGRKAIAVIRTTAARRIATSGRQPIRNRRRRGVAERDRRRQLTPSSPERMILQRHGSQRECGCMLRSGRCCHSSRD